MALLSAAFIYLSFSAHFLAPLFVLDLTERCVRLCKLINVVQHFKAHFNHNQYDDHPFQPYVMVVVQVGAYQVSQLDTVVQLLVHHPCPPADAEVRARLIVERLQLLPVPIEIGRVQ
uniref:Putative secreted protein n=1 Tax=Anopheles darlingi TaxID=43151 RepID=A0A2M4DCW2_ANODA